jgi:hypothetical protein
MYVLAGVPNRVAMMRCPSAWSELRTTAQCSLPLISLLSVQG